MLDDSNPPFYRWFAGSVTNTCYNALDRHVDEGNGNLTALIYDSPVTGTIEKFTFREFRDKVALVTGALQARGVRKGDRIIIYMPMIPEALVALLGVAPAQCTPVEATDPLYIFYTSGTTGQPKGIVRNNGGHMVAMKWSMESVYNVKPGEVFRAASDVGWVVGHSYIVYAPLLQGCTTIVFEGKPVGTPDPGTFWRIISEHDVSVLFTAPTAFRAIKKEDPDGKYIKRYNFSNFRKLFLAKERADHDTVRWAENHLKVPVIDHWWQTETGWAIAANCQGIEPGPVKYGSASKAVPSYEVKVVNEALEKLPRGTMGDIVVKLPLPPGTITTLWRADIRFVESYMRNFPGYYQTSDAGYIDKDGYIYHVAHG